jgi:predicted RND superfamily exporter protein
MSPMTDTISSTSNHKNDKYLTKDRLDIKWERWNVVSAELDPYVKRKFQPNQESERLLDIILELPGITATGLRDRLGAINFATSTNNTGLLMNYLRELSGAKEANRSHHRTAWCGRCEKVSRTYAEQGPGNDGKLTNDCPTCNDNQVRVREREVINDPELLKEFGWVSGLNIMALFLISLLFIPPVLTFLPPPSTKHVKYLENKFLERVLIKIERWTFQHTKWVFAITSILVVVSIMGLMHIKKEAFIVDDLPKKDTLYTDLKWFEKEAGGVMPLEIVIDTKKKNGLVRSIKPLEAIDELHQYLVAQPELGKPLGLLEGIKFAKQAFYDGDSNAYTVPTGTEMAFMAPYLKTDSQKTTNSAGASPTQLLSKFIDSAKRETRVSVNMKDIGSAELPLFLYKLDSATKIIFDTSKYKVEITGSSVTFLEGSNFIVRGLGESIFWAFLLIAICMIFLFRSFPILMCSLVPNIVPLLMTAGLMGWVGISLKPSTVLVFSVALGIAIDVTIRFLVNYKQELPRLGNNVHETLIQTIKHTGISIIYTSLVLVAGFVIFCFSDFGGTKALGWLTSLTLVVSTFTNLILLPALIKTFIKQR